MDGEYLRGEVYWVCLDDSIGGEERTGRPGLVVSADGLNEKNESVTIAFLSKQGFPAPTRPSIADPKGGRSRVLCDQLRTVDKSRLTKYMYTADDSEIIRITGALACTLCIPTPKPEVKTDTDDKFASLRCEAEMWRRMYEKTMDQLVELRVNAIVADRTKTMEVAPKTTREIVKKTALVEPDPGYEEEPAPQKKKTEWDGVKVNINTVKTGKELKQKTGMAMHAASEIIRVRNAVGAYEKVEDLLALEHFGERSMAKYGHMLEV